MPAEPHSTGSSNSSRRRRSGSGWRRAGGDTQTRGHGFDRSILPQDQHAAHCMGRSAVPPVSTLRVRSPALSPLPSRGLCACTRAARACGREEGAEARAEGRAHARRCASTRAVTNARAVFLTVAATTHPCQRTRRWPAQGWRGGCSSSTARRPAPAAAAGRGGAWCRGRGCSLRHRGGKYWTAGTQTVS